MVRVHILRLPFLARLEHPRSGTVLHRSRLYPIVLHTPWGIVDEPILCGSLLLTVNKSLLLKGWL